LEEGGKKKVVSREGKGNAAKAPEGRRKDASSKRRGGKGKGPVRRKSSERKKKEAKEACRKGQPCALKKKKENRSMRTEREGGGKHPFK